MLTEVFAVNRHLDPAVLRSALLRDVDRTHDLQTREQGCEEPSRSGVALNEHPVDAISNPDAVHERLDVDI